MKVEEGRKKRLDDDDDDDDAQVLGYHQRGHHQYTYTASTNVYTPSAGRPPSQRQALAPALMVCVDEHLMEGILSETPPLGNLTNHVGQRASISERCRVVDINHQRLSAQARHIGLLCSSPDVSERGVYRFLALLAAMNAWPGSCSGVTIESVLHGTNVSIDLATVTKKQKETACCAHEPQDSQVCRLPAHVALARRRWSI